VGRRLAALLLVSVSAVSCASRTSGFGPASAERASSALAAWQEVVAAADAVADANLLYEAAVSQKVFRTSGTLAIRLRGQDLEGTLAGPFGSPIATYREGVLSGDKISPISLPARQLRAILSGTWVGAAPEVSGVRGAETLLQWSGGERVDAVFDVEARRVVSLRVARADGELDASYSGRRDPWPEELEIREKRTGSKLRLKRIAFEGLP
jgi:hypothetical protein